MEYERKVLQLHPVPELRGPHGEDWSEVSWQTIMDTFSDDLKKAEEKVKVLAVQRKRGRKEENLHKVLGLTRLTLMAMIKRMHDRGGETDARLFVDLVRLLEQSDDLFSAYEDELEIWSQFKYVIVQKLKKEKLLVYEKKHADKEAFEKAKDRFQDPHGLV
ncbi:Uncharacterised protein [Candidatus Burarchaeum australiense]|nr:Uncharacterised protein [Candidatus Burarchaeum australiense]